MKVAKVLGVLLCLLGMGGWIWRWFDHGLVVSITGTYVMNTLLTFLVIVYSYAYLKRNPGTLKRVALDTFLLSLVAGVICVWVGDWPLGCVLSGIGLTAFSLFF